MRLMFAALALSALLASALFACCPVYVSGKPVVNADQTVLMIWDANTKTQHFIRQASFKSDADDFGFLVPSPTQPELEESGNEAFSYLQKLTEPEKKQRPSGGIGCGCSAGPSRNLVGETLSVQVLAEKRVAGFNAVVLQSSSAAALVQWLREHDYSYSPQVEKWAKPYVDAGWKITALKIAKDADSKDNKRVSAAALRMTFKTDRPLFPYREPDPTDDAAALQANRRLLRIYFLADARYEGALDGGKPWSGRVAWAGKLNTHDCRKTLELLKLPEATGPAQWWLTEFEDDWTYAAAPADVYFARSANQDAVKRDPIYVSAWSSDVAAYALAAVLFVPPLVRRFRRKP